MRQRAAGYAATPGNAAVTTAIAATTVATTVVSTALTLSRGRRGSQGAVFAGVSVFLLHCRRHRCRGQLLARAELPSHRQRFCL